MVATTGREAGGRGRGRGRGLFFPHGWRDSMWKLIKCTIRAGGVGSFGSGFTLLDKAEMICLGRRSGSAKRQVRARDEK